MEEQSMFDEMRAAGSRLPDIVEYLRANGWQSYAHHDNWIPTKWIGDSTKDPMRGLSTHDAYRQCLAENK